MPEKVEDTQENMSSCICPECPSYPEDDVGGLYCGKGKANADVNRRGCICGDCEVWKSHGLEGTYYCATGAA